MDVKGKRLLVVGFGASGQAAARLLALQGASVLVIDEAKDEIMKRRARRKKFYGIPIQFGVGTVPIGRFDAAILSPGVHPHRGIGLDVANLDIPVYGEIELGSWFCQCPMIAVTGTNGKTTTTELIERTIRVNRKRVLPAGNIGNPLSEAALKSDKLDYLAVEISSFQLETIDCFRPFVSVMMNITPDHLDRYLSMEKYAAAKAAIWKNQCGNDIAIINLDTERYLAKLGFTPPVRTLRYSTHGKDESTAVDLWFDGKYIRGPLLEKTGIEASLSQTRLRGAHNAENVMATLAVIFSLGLNLEKAWKTICDYQPLAHRLETVGILRGMEFINDSKATNIDAMEKAIKTFTQPVVLIAGGKDKGFDFSSIAPLIHEKVKTCILIGEARERIFQVWKDVTSCVFADSLEEAANIAIRIGQQGDVVLFSPGCSSYDMFKNYEERGKAFCQAVQQLSSNQ